MKFSKLTEQYRAGTLAEADLEGVTAEDALKLRQDANDGILSATVDIDALLGVTLAEEAEGDEMGDGKKKRRKASYVLVSDGNIPPFNDRVKATAWDLKEFVYRGSNVLWNHNIEETLPPIGKGANLKRNVEMKRGGREFRALTGDVEFASGEVYPFAELIGGLVEEGLLTGVSVGFYVDDARPFSEKERADDETLRSYSSLITKARLYEFSVTPIGRDPNALRLSATGEETSLMGRLDALAAEGVYDDDVIGRLRQTVLATAGQPERFSIHIPGLRVPPPIVAEPVPSSTVTLTGDELNASPITFLEDDPTGTVKGPTAEQFDALLGEVRSLRSEIRDLRAEVIDTDLDAVEGAEEEDTRDRFSAAWDAVDELLEETKDTSTDAEGDGADEEDPIADLLADELGLDQPAA